MIMYDQANGALERYDSRAQFVWQAQILPSPGPSWEALGVDRQGNALLLFDGHALFGTDSVGAVWVSHEGVADTPFQIGSDIGEPWWLFPRIGGGLFVQKNHAWIGQLDAFATTMVDAPAWLKARPNTRLRMVYGGKAYAVLASANSSSSCPSQQVEVLSPNGTSCGLASFGNGGACSWASLEIGYDGTVIQTQPTSSTGCQGGSCATWEYWPQFFGKTRR